MPRTKKIVAAPVTTHSASIPPTPPNAELAYSVVVHEVEAVKDEELVPINLDISQAALVVVGALPGIWRYKDRLAQLPDFDMRNLTHLQNYASAARYAHIQAFPSTEMQMKLRGMVDEGTALRARLLNEAEPLVRNGVFDAAEIAAVRAGQGHVDLADDLVAMGGMFAKAWSSIAGRTFITEAEVKRAKVLGTELFAALGMRDWGDPQHAPNRASRPGDNRAKAFTLLVTAYDQVRRGLSYLRWREGDVDEIAPSIYRSRARPTPEKVVEKGSGSNGVDAAPPPASPPAVDAGAPG